MMNAELENRTRPKGRPRVRTLTPLDATPTAIQMTEAALRGELAKMSSGPGDRPRRAEGIAAAIRDFGTYRWVGIYDVAANEVAIVGWDGLAAPAHPRFPRDRGLCGAAIAAGEPVVVGDVGADPRYLTTHATTRSEIVVPVFRAGVVAGLIDVESEQPSAFDQNDTRFLERCAVAIVPLWTRARGARPTRKGA